MSKNELNLVDQLGLLDAEIKQLTERKEALRATIIGELAPQGGGTIEGQLYSATVRNGSRSYYDKAELERRVDAKVLRKCEKVTAVITISVKRK